MIRSELEQESIPPISEEEFSLDESIIIAEKLINSHNQIFKSSFNDDLWTFIGVAKNKTFIDFRKLIPFQRFSSELPNNIDLIIRCWLAELSSDITIKKLQASYHHLLEVIEKTNGFQKNTVEYFLEQFAKDSRADTTKFYMINSILNFLNYSDIKCGEPYIRPLIIFKSKLKKLQTSISLPPSKDVLIFSWCLEKYFKEISAMKFSSDNNEHSLKFLYYPVLIWWKLTNVIPLRPSEFCAIKRDCLISDETNRMFIRLPRHKHSDKNIQVLDKIEINTDIFKLIKTYIEETEKFGATETLISYLSIIEGDKNTKELRKVLKIDHHIFTKNILRYLILNFYRNIVNKKYGYSIQPLIRPGHTRHFAIISLMMQGISPIEIARLANHKTVAMQYHYSFHTEYWVDSQVFELMTKFKFEESFYKLKSSKSGQQIIEKSFPFIPDEVKMKAFKPPTSPGCMKPLKELGYCSDEIQRCESDECIFCSHWRVTPDELYKNLHIIRGKIAHRKRNIDELVVFLEKLHQNILCDELYSANPLCLNQLKSTSSKISEEVNQLAELTFLKGVISND
jgi:hypothetical protein